MVPVVMADRGGGTVGTVSSDGLYEYWLRKVDIGGSIGPKVFYV